MKRYLVLLMFFTMLLFSSKAMAISVDDEDDGNVLANVILGTGITITSVTYIGDEDASGTFTGGIASGIGMESGIILTSGKAELAEGPNNLSNSGVDNWLDGDDDLDLIVSPSSTFDATVLEINFVSSGGDLSFDYVFASEEYNEWVNEGFNDVFGAFLDGQNIALIPGTNTPVSVDNVNSTTNSGFYNNNDSAPFFDIEYDGFTDVFTAWAYNLTAGAHTLKLAIADTGDYIYDSAVFIQTGSFAVRGGDPIPEPATIALLGIGLAGLGGRYFRRRRKRF